MKLDGGITTYNSDKRYKTDKLPTGRKVKFLDNNGYTNQLMAAKEHFVKDQILTVNEILVGGSSSQVEFFEAPGLWFNTVMFGDIDNG